MRSFLSYFVYDLELNWEKPSFLSLLSRAKEIVDHFSSSFCKLHCLGSTIDASTLQRFMLQEVLW